ncbi:hypothetical protein [Myceligenerans salitolerans]|nr:hypothetical protein [Myceligenerans salitolerans]
MIIVHGITTGLDGSGTLVAHGGQIIVHDPWLPTDDELTPISFWWQRAQ